jgi:hypothetical protein
MWLPYPPDIASSFEDHIYYDLFFFFGFFWLTVQDILARSPPQPSSQAILPKNHPVKTDPYAISLRQ